MLKHIIFREFKVLVNTKSQIIGTLFTVILILAAGIAGKYFLDQNADEDTANSPVSKAEAVSLAPEMKDLEQILDSTGIVSAEVITAQSDYSQWLKDEAKKDTPSAATVVAGTLDAPKIIQYGDSSANEITAQAVKQALTLYHVNEITGGVSQDQAAKIAAAMNVPVTIVTGSSNLIGENPIGFFTAVAAQVLLFFAVITGLSTISIGVVEEKSSRVVEILLSSVRPRTLLLGKILGIGLFVLLQLALYISAAVISLKISGLWMGFEISALIVWMIVWILVGFFIFVTISGGISATVSRQEDLGGIITPITIGMMIPFYLGMYLVPALPDSIWTKVLSMIPGFSSFIMPARQAFDTVETWELFLAAGIGIVCLPLLAALSGKIYENSILRMGKRVSLREALSKK